MPQTLTRTFTLRVHARSALLDIDVASLLSVYQNKEFKSDR